MLPGLIIQAYLLKKIFFCIFHFRKRNLFYNPEYRTPFHNCLFDFKFRFEISPFSANRVFDSNIIKYKYYRDKRSIEPGMETAIFKNVNFLSLWSDQVLRDKPKLKITLKPEV